MSPTTSIRPAVASRCRACDIPIPIDESAIAGQKIGTPARYAAVRIPSLLGFLPEILAEPVEELARRIRASLERQHECGNPFVVVDELVFLRIGVVDPVDMLRLQRGIVFTRRTDVVAATARLVQIVVQIGAGRDQAVDVPVGDQVGDDHPQPAGAESAGHAEKDGAIVAQHLLPDAARRGEIAALKRNALHALEDLVCWKAGFDGKRFHGRAKKTGFRFHPRIFCHGSHRPRMWRAHDHTERPFHTPPVSGITPIEQLAIGGIRTIPWRRLDCVSRGLKGVAYAGKESRARAIPGRITRPRSTAGERHRQVMTEHEIERQFAADRCAEVRGLELPIPGVTSVEKGGRVNAPEEERPVADATLRTREGYAKVDIRDGSARADEIVGGEAAEQPDRIPAEIKCRHRRAGAASRELASNHRVAPRAGKGNATGQHGVTGEPLEAARLDDGCATIAVRSERFTRALCRRFDLNTLLSADRVAERAAAVVNPAAAERAPPLFRRKRARLIATDGVVIDIERT